MINSLNSRNFIRVPVRSQKSPASPNRQNNIHFRGSNWLGDDVSAFDILEAFQIIKAERAHIGRAVANTSAISPEERRKALEQLDIDKINELVRQMHAFTNNADLLSLLEQDAKTIGRLEEIQEAVKKITDQK